MKSKKDTINIRYYVTSRLYSYYMDTIVGIFIKNGKSFYVYQIKVLYNNKPHTKDMFLSLDDVFNYIKYL